MTDSNNDLDTQSGDFEDAFEVQDGDDPGDFIPAEAPGAPDDFRSNLHRGGSAQLIKITPEERSTAVRAAKRMGLNVCGVDMLRSNHGPVIMEVNSSPGLEGIESATGKDVAGMVIRFLEKDARPFRTQTKGAKG